MSEYYEVILNPQIKANKIASYKTYFERAEFNGNVKNKIANSEKDYNVLSQLRQLIESSIDLEFRDKSFCSDDGFLQRFIYASKRDAQRAFQLLKNYIRYKETNRVLLNNLNIFDDKIQLAIKDGNPAVLKERDRRGRKVITFTASHWNVRKYSLHDIYRALLLTLDKLLEDVQNQMLGIVVLVDWTNCTMQQSCSLSPSVLKTMTHGLQVNITHISNKNHSNLIHFSRQSIKRLLPGKHFGSFRNWFY